MWLKNEKNLHKREIETGTEKTKPLNVRFEINTVSYNRIISYYRIHRWLEMVGTYVYTYYSYHRNRIRRFDV